MTGALEAGDDVVGESVTGLRVGVVVGQVVGVAVIGEAVGSELGDCDTGESVIETGA